VPVVIIAFAYPITLAIKWRGFDRRAAAFAGWCSTSSAARRR